MLSFETDTNANNRALKYYILNALQEKGYEGRNEISTLQELKDTITAKWQELSLSGICRAMNPEPSKVDFPMANSV